MRQLINTKLPDQLSDLIELALADLTKVESQPDRYRVNMMDWVGKYNDDAPICNVCLAGAVMVGTCQLDTESLEFQSYTPSDLLDPSMTGAMMALNAARVGKIITALIYLGKRISVDTRDRISSALFEFQGPCLARIVTYEKSPEEWKKVMNRIIEILRKEGL